MCAMTHMARLGTHRHASHMMCTQLQVVLEVIDENVAQGSRVYEQGHVSEYRSHLVVVFHKSMVRTVTLLNGSPSHACASATTL